jgi:hypothetical protein
MMTRMTKSTLVKKAKLADLPDSNLVSHSDTLHCQVIVTIPYLNFHHRVLAPDFFAN